MSTLTRYFTGRPCKRGHVCERFISTRKCVECCKLEREKYQSTEEYKTYQREYYWKNYSKEFERKKAYRTANREKIKKYSAEWYLDNRSKMLRSAAQWYRKNRSKVLDRHKFGPTNPTGERQWLRKNFVQLQAIRKQLRNPQGASKLLQKALKLGLNLQI